MPHDPPSRLPHRPVVMGLDMQLYEVAPTMKLLGFVVRLLAKYAFVGVAIFFSPSELSGTKYSSYSRSRRPPAYQQRLLSTIYFHFGVL